MAEIVKHVGRFGEKPCVIVFRELPQEKENCLITQTSSLPDRMHDELMDAVQSPEAQSAPTLADVLSRKIFSDGQPMLNALHYGKHLQKVPVSHVTTTPLPNQSMPLAELNEAIAKLEGGYVPPVNDETHLNDNTTQPVSRSVPESQNTTDDETQESDSADLARNLLTQGEMMMGDAESLRKDAEAKLEEAYKLDPSLRPKKRGRRPKTQKSE